MSDQQGFTVWFTGLSGSGKSTIAEMLFHEFQSRGMKTEILDGDVVRQNLSKGLGFSKEDRDLNILRIGFVANLLTRNGVATICCPISPYKETRDELIARLEAQAGPDGERLGTKVLKPQDVYTEVRGVAPDLIVYFGDLEWRSIGSVGNPSLYTYENDTGPDGANHDRDGIFVMKGLQGQRTGKVDGLKLVDVGPSILSIYDIDATEALPGAVGRSFLQ